MGRRRNFSALGVRIVAALFLGVILILCALPLLWMTSTAFKPSTELLVSPPTLIPRQPTLRNFVRLFELTDFLIQFWNSVWVTFWATGLTLVVATLGAYSLTRFKYRGRDTIAVTTLFTYMFAPIMIIVPIYIIMHKVGLTDTRTGLILSYITFSLPFGLWLLRSFFLGIPLELEEAAFIDGAGRLKTIALVTFPLALPGVIATGIFNLLLAWNDYIFARILVSTSRLKVAPIGMQDIHLSSRTDWGMLMAAGVTLTVPTLIFFLFIQRYLVQGWGAGGVKG